MALNLFDGSEDPTERQPQESALSLIQYGTPMDKDL